MNDLKIFTTKLIYFNYFGKQPLLELPFVKIDDSGYIYPEPGKYLSNDIRNFYQHNLVNHTAKEILDSCKKTAKYLDILYKCKTIYYENNKDSNKSIKEWLWKVVRVVSTY